MSGRKRKKFERTCKLFHDQDGRCWICGLPMLEPNGDRLKGKNPGKWEVTVDHLIPGNEPLINHRRPTKGAHRYCNSGRGHAKLDEIQPLIKKVKAQFSKKDWVTLVFGPEIVKQLVVEKVIINTTNSDCAS